MDSRSGLSGHDKNFLKTPPDELICLICHCVARDPLQTQCCGKLYCKSCLDRLKGQSEATCPTCRKRRLSTFSDHISGRRIKALKVVCDNEGNGCKWMGELDHLEQHIAAKCKLVEVPCSNDCCKVLVRRNMKKHLKHECPRREYRCRYCKELGEYQIMTGEHLEECPDIIIPCPNSGCHVRKTRLEIKVHRQTCPKEEVACSYFEIGCEGYRTRESVEQHEIECMEHHLQLAMKEIKSLRAATASLQAVTASLQAVTASSKEVFSIPPQVFKMTNFDQLKRDNEEWHSPPFHTHTGGYKMCLSIDANGNGKGEGTHVSVFVKIMSSKNDKNLRWPFRGEITFELLNQLDDTCHVAHTVPYESKETENHNCGAHGGLSGGWGRSKFISYSALGHNPANSCQYLKDDCLYFRVTQAKLNKSDKSWLSS